MKFIEKVINESGKVSSCSQPQAVISRVFIWTGLTPDDHMSFSFLICESRWLPYFSVGSYVTFDVWHVTCTYNMF